MTISLSISGPMRRDALERRKALLDAAMVCFEEQGYGVPLEEIADRAGVGRGTLYRNFKDRVALALAMFEREIDRLCLDPVLDLPLEDALIAMRFQHARLSALFTRLTIEVQLTHEQYAAFGNLAHRVEQALTPLVLRSHAQGRLRPEIGAAEILIALRMLGGLSKPFRGETENEAQFAAGLGMLLAGLAPR